MSYSIFFDRDHETIKLPVNPEEVTVSKSQTIETYKVLKLGQIAKPTEDELERYSFEAEFPSKAYNYVTTAGGFQPADFYITRFTKWLKDKKPVLFKRINNESDDISKWVLFESIEIVEKAGEEGDFYISFKLIEYKEFGKKMGVLVTKVNYGSSKTVSKPKKQTRAGEPKKPKTHTVMSGDSLWSISKRYLGDGNKYNELIAVNPQIKNPGLLKLGQVIKIS